MTDNFEHPLEMSALLGGDLDRKLPNQVREVLLDVILAWADLDMTTGFFVSQVTGMDPDSGAEKYGRKFIEDKLKKASRALSEKGHLSMAKSVLSIANEYPEKSLFRRRIAHSKCAGVRRTANNRIVFLPFEREGPPGHLAVEVIDVSQFVEAKEWAEQVSRQLIDYVDGEGFFNADISVQT